MDAVCNFVGQPPAAFAGICFFKKADFRFFRLVGCRVRQKPGQRVRVFPVSAPYQIKQLFAAGPGIPFLPAFVDAFFKFRFRRFVFREHDFAAKR